MRNNKRNIHGLEMFIENPAGTFRRGTSPTGKPWETYMHSHYGELVGTEGVDGDPVDVFTPPKSCLSDLVVVVHQNDPDTGDYDEDKIMWGYDSVWEALKEYMDHYDEPEKFIGPHSIFTAQEMVDLLKNTDGVPQKLSKQPSNKFVELVTTDYPTTPKP